MLIDYIKDDRHIEDDIFEAIKTSSAPVILWGAGEIAWCVWTYLRSHDIEPVGICDNNPAKHGTEYLGLPVYSYETLRGKFSLQGGKYNIVIATGPQYKDPICEQLKKANEQNPVFYLMGYEVCGEKITYQYICNHIRLFEEAYFSLSDEFSKKVFVNIINAKLSGNFNLCKEIMSEIEYFDHDVVTLKDNEIFMDVGAYKGNSIVEFVKITEGKYDGIIALEPDKKTFATLQQRLSARGIDNVELHNKGAWEKHSLLKFHDGREGGSRLLETSATACPSTTIEVDAIDNVLQGRRVTYISMDIEGAEHSAILGAEKTIKKWKPKIAVCCYHRREDLFDLLLLLKSFLPQYKFYMRHYTDNQTETVLYAI